MNKRIELIKRGARLAEGFELVKQTIGKPYLWYTEPNGNRMGMKIEEVESRFMFTMFLDAVIHGLNASDKYDIVQMRSNIIVTESQYFEVVQGKEYQARLAALTWIMEQGGLDE